ncbi:MFS transporter [Martelella alba]|uniref:MFS transporter n=1 Tax=Martelella alba TaxID=2590451 RepID=A0ABY2SEM0_9HYPH|nr:MFS transporter [Martelella alba]TKI02924.1 MFS transporter [Martelella alba]
MEKKNAPNAPFLLAVMGIYLSYFLHGVSVITLAQNMTQLATKFGTDSAGIAYLISGIGLGRLISILFFGVISDKFGRRAVILLGIGLYVLFFFGIPASPNLFTAYILAVCVGVANAALDTGAYPALMEAYPKTSGSAVILIKAMVSFGQMLYPLLVGYLLLNKMWYGYGIIVPGILFVLIAALLMKSRFPSQNVDANLTRDLPQIKRPPLMWLEGAASVVFGVAIFSTFYIIVVWMPKYAMAYAGMSEAEALRTISYYSMGSLVCVFAFALLLKNWVRPVWANVFNSALAVIAGIIIYAYPTPLVCNISAFVIGFSAAGGLLQLGVSVMSEFFPKSKAKVTSVYMLMGGLSNFVIPIITGYLSKIGLNTIILLDVACAAVSLITAIIVFYRYYQVFSIPANDVRVGESVFFLKTANNKPSHS